MTSYASPNGSVNCQSESASGPGSSRSTTLASLSDIASMSRRSSSPMDPRLSEDALGPDELDVLEVSEELLSSSDDSARLGRLDELVEELDRSAAGFGANRRHFGGRARS